MFTSLFYGEMRFFFGILLFPPDLPSSFIQAGKRGRLRHVKQPRRWGVMPGMVVVVRRTFAYGRFVN